MTQPNPTDVNKPAENVGSAPTGGEKPATPSPEAQKQGQPTPEAQKQGASPQPPAQKEVPIAALHEERNKRQEEHSRAEQLEREVAELRRMVSESQMHQHQVPQQPAPQVDPRQELEQVWEEDPKKAVRMEIMYAMDWRDRIDSSLEVQADQLARKYPDFNNYRSTALGQVRALPLNQRGGQGILEAAYFMVRGQNADQLIQQREADLLEKYRRGEISAQGLANPSGTFSAPPAPESQPMTDEQARVAAAMGLTPEQYMAGQVQK